MRPTQLDNKKQSAKINELGVFVAACHDYLSDTIIQEVRVCYNVELINDIN